MSFLVKITNAVNSAYGTRFSVGKGENNSLYQANKPLTDLQVQQAKKLVESGILPHVAYQMVNTQNGQPLQNSINTIVNDALKGSTSDIINKLNQTNGANKLNETLSNIGTNIATNSIIQTLKRLWYIPVGLILIAVTFLTMKPKKVNKIPYKK